MQVLPINLDEAIRARDFATLRDAFDGLPPSELATLIQDLPIEKQATVFRILKRASWLVIL